MTRLINGYWTDLSNTGTRIINGTVVVLPDPAPPAITDALTSGNVGFRKRGRTRRSR